LHHDRIVASDRIVQGYLSQLKAILAGLPQTLEQPPKVESFQLNSDALLARLTQAALLLQDPIVSAPESQLAESDAEDLDLSIDPEGAVWEEWVEDEDFSTASTKPDWEENWVQRHLNPVESNIPNSHTTAELATSSPRWDKFVPECINIDTAPQSRTSNNSDIYR
jgi:Tfp pilus assembly protein FimV